MQQFTSDKQKMKGIKKIHVDTNTSYYWTELNQMHYNEHIRLKIIQRGEKVTLEPLLKRKEDS